MYPLQYLSFFFTCTCTCSYKYMWYYCATVILDEYVFLVNVSTFKVCFYSSLELYTYCFVFFCRGLWVDYQLHLLLIYFATKQVKLIHSHFCFLKGQIDILKFNWLCLFSDDCVNFFFKWYLHFSPGFLLLYDLFETHSLLHSGWYSNDNLTFIQKIFFFCLNKQYLSQYNTIVIVA